MKLYEYQKELLNSEEDIIVANWCRGAGKDTAVAMYIVEHKPSVIAYHGYNQTGIEFALENLMKYENFTIEDRSFEGFKIVFKNTGRDLTFQSLSENQLRGRKDIDLLIDGGEYRELDFAGIEFKKYIKLTTKNAYSLKEIANSYKITVDYKRMIKENPDVVETVVKAAYNNARFFDEYDLLAKKPKGELTFLEFSNKALLKLQKQFLETPDTKDTVLTRKNIIEMIKDLRELN